MEKKIAIDRIHFNEFENRWLAGKFNNNFIVLLFNILFKKLLLEKELQVVIDPKRVG